MERVLVLSDLLVKDTIATRITEQWIDWDQRMQSVKRMWEETRRYVYATDTTQTTNAKLPWKNKTTIPKLCQIRDNLYSNYIATLFPRRKWLIWEANDEDSNSVNKAAAITNYMNWVISQPSFKHEMDKVIYDYIDYGNCFVMPEWEDERVQEDIKTTGGFVGPRIRRISPLDIRFNPVADSFEHAPKVIRSYINVGELKKLLSRMSSDENQEEYEALFRYLMEIRSTGDEYMDDVSKDNMFIMEGFGSFRDYLSSDTVEVLTFYGDIYDPETGKFYENHVITVVDRHKVIGLKPNPSFFGYPPIFHAAWRKRQDNLWGMGPLDNLIGMQYRLDHVENMKADIFDLVTYPVKKIKGDVEPFVWQPGEDIYVSEEGDVELVTPEVQVLQANIEIQYLERLMEEMAGAPREAMGFRTPGEKTKYEIQRMENAASRLYQNKINQFEENVSERAINGMLELSKRNLTGPFTIKVFDDEFKLATFQTLTVEDITGIGRIKPVAARHFAEQADLIQNLTNLSVSNIWPVVMPHFSSVRLAKLFETMFEIEDYNIVIPYIQLSEQAEAQRLQQTLQEQVYMEGGTATGIGEDYDMDRSFEVSSSAEASPSVTPQP